MRFFRNIVLIGIIIGVAIAGFLWFTAPGQPKTAFTTIQGNAERGAYIMAAGGCLACHTKVKDKGPLLAGGDGIHSPFGTFFGPNITPDPEHGIGGWTVDQFAAAMVRGMAPNGGRYYPVFPYTHYSLMSDQDVADLWTHLKTIPASNQPDQPHDLGFPFNVRLAMRFWQSVFFAPKPFKSDPDQSDEWNRGAYLVNGPAHCGACHSPRTLAGNIVESKAFMGGVIGKNEKVPGITKTILGDDWNKENMIEFLSTGTTPGFDVVGGEMTLVIEENTSQLSDEDKAAIAEYLLSLK